MVELRPVDYTNDTAVIRRFSRMVAINSAIEVDVTGQVVRRLDRLPLLQRRRRPDGLHPRRGAGAAGARDHRAAVDRREGHRVAHHADAAGGAGVVTTRAHVRTVVTEYGVAELHGRTVGERAAP